MIDDAVRLVYLVSTLRRAGPTAQLLNILRHLDRSRFEPMVVTLSPETADSMMEDFRRAAVPVKSFAMSRLHAAVHRDWRRSIEELVGASLGGSCVVHSQGIRGDSISARQLRGVKRLATARNYPYEDYPMKFGPVLGRWMALMHLRAFRALPTVVSCSSTLAAELRRHRVESVVIRNGVDASRFHPPDPQLRAALRAKFGFGATQRVGVCVGALSARKDSLAVVRAALALDDPALVMVFVGGGPLERECRVAAGNDPRIRFTGEVADVAGYLQSADFFVSASRSEGLPNSVLEAVACGLRSVLTDIGPHREVLEVAGPVGELYPVGQEEGLCAAMRRAVAQMSTRVDATGIDVKVGSESMSKRYQALYLRLAGDATDALQPA